MHPNHQKQNNIVAEAAATAGLVTSEDLGFQLTTGITVQQRVDTAAFVINYTPRDGSRNGI